MFARRPSSRPFRCLVASVTAVAALAAGAARSAVVPQQSPEREALLVRHPDLYIPNVFQRPAALPADVRAQAEADLAALGVAPGMAFFDLRGGTWGTLLGRRALIPGDGRGNSLGWAALGGSAPADDAALGAAAWSALQGYLQSYREELRIDPAELGAEPGVTVLEGGRIVQLHGRREIGGVAVRGSSLNAVLNGGNLVLFGARNWGPVGLSTAPALSL